MCYNMYMHYQYVYNICNYKRTGQQAILKICIYFNPDIKGCCVKDFFQTSPVNT